MTEAGKRLLRRYDEEWPEKFDIDEGDIAAIEAEAVAARNAEIAAAVRGLPGEPLSELEQQWALGPFRAAVLALLEEP